MMTYDALFRLPPPDALTAWAFPWAAGIDGAPWRDTDDAYHLERRVHGFRKKDITIEVRGRTLEIRGARERGFVNRERRAFREVFTLPEGADASDVSADIRGDALWIRVGKEPAARRRRIPVRSDTAPVTTAGDMSTALARASWLPAPMLQRLAAWVRTFGGRALAWVKGA